MCITRFLTLRYKFIIQVLKDILGLGCSYNVQAGVLAICIIFSSVWMVMFQERNLVRKSPDFSLYDRADMLLFDLGSSELMHSVPNTSHKIWTGMKFESVRSMATFLLVIVVFPQVLREAVTLSGVCLYNMTYNWQERLPENTAIPCSIYSASDFFHRMHISSCLEYRQRRQILLAPCSCLVSSGIQNFHCH